jgi:hypothetical protein
LVHHVRAAGTIVDGLQFRHRIEPPRFAAQSPHWATLCRVAINGLFFRNAVNFGLFALDCPGTHGIFEQGQTAELSLEDFSVRNHDTGALLKTQPVPRGCCSI